MASNKRNTNKSVDNNTGNNEEEFFDKLTPREILQTEDGEPSKYYAISLNLNTDKVTVEQIDEETGNIVILLVEFDEDTSDDDKLLNAKEIVDGLMDELFILHFKKLDKETYDLLNQV